MKTIHIRKTDGSPAVFNFEHVVSIEPAWPKPQERSVVIFITGQGWQVQEEYHRLMGRILQYSDEYIQKWIEADTKSKE